MIERTLEKILQNHLDKIPKGLILLGPRQTGKSTLLRHFSPVLIIDLADETTYRNHLRDSGLLRAQVDAVADDAVIFIDEVQRLPELLNTVQSLIDQRKDLRFLLTGSSARKLKRGNANLLPGRLFWYRLYSLTFWELKPQFDLERALTIGTLPEIYLQAYGADLLQNYVNTYIREEIQAEAITRSIASFERFIDLAAECSGQIVNYSSLASDSEIPKETIRRFYQVLVDTLLVHRISNYQALRPHRKAAQKDMYIFFDMGIRNAILGRQKNKFSQAELGKLFEQWFICQVIAYNEYAQKGWTIHYYRDDAKNEVDLVIEQPKRIIAVEVKLSKSFKPSFTEGLHAIAESSKKPVHQYLVYCGTERQARETIKVEPFEYFLSEILPKL